MEKENIIDFAIKDDIFKSMEEEITCSICSDIKINPVMCTDCQNSFCSKCISNWKLKNNQCPFKCKSFNFVPARVVKNLISKLKFKCKNGCNEIISFDNLNKHCEEECKKLDFKTKYKNLLTKFNDLQSDYFELQSNFNNLLDFNINSTIINNNPNELYFIYKILLKHYTKKFKLELLYRATKDGDSSKNFHDLCDNKKGGILILIKTDKNIKFGGFSDAEWISFFDSKKPQNGKNVCGTINFLFQINLRKVYELKNSMKKLTSIYCRSDVGPCFGELGEDIWIKSMFLTKGGILHKDKDKGRICSYDTTDDYELNNGERTFVIKEIEAFWLRS